MRKRLRRAGGGETPGDNPGAGRKRFAGCGAIFGPRGFCNIVFTVVCKDPSVLN